MGSRTIRKIECGWFAPPGAIGLFLWNRERTHHRVLGSPTSLSLHHGSGILRSDPLLGGIALRARELPSRAHPAASSRSTHALATRNGGFDAGLCAGLSGHPPDATAVAHQSGKWIVFLLGLTVAYFLLKRHRQSSC